MPEASAPASSANLGPGFDTLAVAYELRCRVTARPAGEWSVRHDNGADYGENDAVLSAASTVSSQPLALEVSCQIPPARGMGSSAAAYAAGTLAAFRADGSDPSREEVFSVVSDLEGHPDNAAAAVFGGLVAVAPDGTVAALELDSELRVVLAIPANELSTTRARGALPKTVSHDAAVRNVGRVSALIEGLRTGSAGLLAAAAGDELHEPYRSDLYPQAAELMIAATNAGAWHTCWSGAGPSVLAFCSAASVAAITAALEASLSETGVVMAPALGASGVH